MGDRVEWEDVFCLAFGSPWRQLRDDCQTLQQWMQWFPSFADKVCNAWGLPAICGMAPGATSETFQTDGPAKKQACIEKWQLSEIPYDHGQSCPQVHWEKFPRSFAFVVDCKPVADILNGRCPLKSASSGPMHERMTDRIVRMLACSWGPHVRAGDPVLWQPRKYNQIADFLANHAMETPGLAALLPRSSPSRCKLHLPLRWRQAE